MTLSILTLDHSEHRTSIRLTARRPPLDRWLSDARSLLAAVNYFILTTILSYYNNLLTHTVAARSINSRRVTSLTERWISRFLIAYVEGRSELTIFGCDARKFIIAYISDTGHGSTFITQRRESPLLTNSIDSLPRWSARRTLTYIALSTYFTVWEPGPNLNSLL